ncbi:Protein of unknown function [Gryllus bimaculatus]|nr:Protein of unknown function [Gryllus bimaculatus]
MDNIGLLSECVIKVEEIKVETDGDTEEILPNYTVSYFFELL